VAVNELYSILLVLRPTAREANRSLKK